MGARFDRGAAGGGGASGFLFLLGDVEGEAGVLVEAAGALVRREAPEGHDGEVAAPELGESVLEEAGADAAPEMGGVDVDRVDLADASPVGVLVSRGADGAVAEQLAAALEDPGRAQAVGLGEPREPALRAHLHAERLEQPVGDPAAEGRFPGGGAELGQRARIARSRRTQERLFHGREYTRAPPTSLPMTTLTPSELDAIPIGPQRAPAVARSPARPGRPRPRCGC